MYELIIEELCLAGVAEELDTPKWMDMNGKEVDEELAYGCKVTHAVTYPEWIIFMDEVGSDTSQKGDGHIGGEKRLGPASRDRTDST